MFSSLVILKLIKTMLKRYSSSIYSVATDTTKLLVINCKEEVAWRVWITFDFTLILIDADHISNILS